MLKCPFCDATYARMVLLATHVHSYHARVPYRDRVKALDAVRPVDTIQDAPSSAAREELAERTRVVGEGLACVRDELTKLREQVHIIDVRAEAAQLSIKSLSWNRLTTLSEVADKLIEAGHMDAYRIVSDMITTEAQR